MWVDVSGAKAEWVLADEFSVVNQGGNMLGLSEVGVVAGISVELMAVEPVLSVLSVPEQKVSSADDSSGGTVWFNTMLLFQIINLFFATIYKLFLQMMRSVFPPAKQYAYAMQGEDTGTFGADSIYRFINGAELMGYETTFDLIPKASAIQNNIDKEFVYFFAHGSPNAIEFTRTGENDVYLLNNGYTTGSSNEIIIGDISLTRPKLIIYAGCQTAQGSNNIARSTLNQGAKCVIGWEKTVYADDISKWMNFFQTRLEQGDTILAAFDFATKSEGYGDNSIRSAELHGTPANQQKKIKIN